MDKRTVIYRIKLLFAVGLYFCVATQANAQKNITDFIKVYFTQPVDTPYSNGVNATYLNNTVFDTLAAYINRSKYSIDIAQYEYETWSGDSIYTALNNAKNRGVKIRLIEDYGYASQNTGVAKLSNISILISPKPAPACNGGNYNIMHNKFVIIDEYAADTTQSIVWTGSPDWDADMSAHDYNNVIIFQSQVLAKAFTNEFDIMWGDTTHGGAAVLANSKFGPCKPNSGTHIFNIGGSKVELYFSPSDSVNTKIINTIAKANVDLYCGMFTFTEAVNATDIVNQKDSGATAYAILDAYSSGTYSPYTTILPNGLGANFHGYVDSAYLYHNKYLIVNPSAPCDDPAVLTGSYNWTSSADKDNDENTVIVHNDTIANFYLQAFAEDFKVIAGTALKKVANPCNITFNLKLYIQGYYLSSGLMTPVLKNELASSNSNVVDTVTISLVDSATLTVKQTAKGVLQTNGALSVTFPGTLAGIKYYIKINHRNAIETWSANTVTMSNGGLYDFTTSPAKAYGSNEAADGDGTFSFYSGDINQDGGIDGDDFMVLYPDIQSGKGGYITTDVNGDGGVDGSDFLMLYPNIKAGRGTLHP